MSTSANAKVQIEIGRTLQSFTQMTDGGDRTVFYRASIWSGMSGYEPDVRPNGIITGRNILSTHDDDDTVTVAAFTAYSKGTLQTVSATTATITRPNTAGKSQVVSVTMASDGSIATVEGTIGADTTFSETRDAAGGPPLIPVNSVEIGQIRTTTSTAAAIASSEIFQVVGTHAERYDYPTWEEYNLGDGDDAETTAQENAYIEFPSALPASHTGPVAKGVYIQYYTPTFGDLSKAMDFVPAENSHSISSTEYYNGTIASRSKSLGQGGFTALLNDGIKDTLVANQDEVLTVKFFPDRNKSAYILTQGAIGLGRTFPVNDQNQASVTVSAERKSVNFSS